MDLRSEMCKTCIHTKVCNRDKNLIGDRFFAGNPLIFDNEEKWKQYKEWEKAGFPCDEYIQSAQPEPSDVARDIATIIENEQDMRVIAQADIVHCGECKYWRTAKYDCRSNDGTQGEEGYWYWCENEVEGTMLEDDFCSKGVRREDGYRRDCSKG